MKSYKYKYNGKELQNELGLDLYDYGARNYDPAIGRWMNVDPLAVKYFPVTPYAYVVNSPLILIDPDGRRIIGTSKESANRLLDIIASTFGGENAEALRSLFKLSKDGKTLQKINKKEFKSAISNLWEDQQALAKGFYIATNSKNKHYVEIVKRSEKTTDFTDNLTGLGDGKEVENMTSGGLNFYSKGLPKGDNLTVIVSDSQTVLDYVDGNGNTIQKLPSVQSKVAHELIGHGLSNNLYNFSDEANLQAIQVENILLRIQNGGNLYRNGSDHNDDNAVSRKGINSIPFHLRGNFYEKY